MQAHAANPGSPQHASLAACKGAPTLAGNSYVWGAIDGQLAPASLARAGFSQRPGVRTFRSAFLPHVSACVALNPCARTLFAGFLGMERPVRAALPRLDSLQWRLTGLMANGGNLGVPPAWRDAPTALPTFWDVLRPDVPQAVGRALPRAAVAPAGGRLFLAGALRGGAVELDGASLALGQQASAWLLWHPGQQHADVSLRLGSPPALVLVGGPALPLHMLPALKEADLLLRTATSEAWLTASQAAVPVPELASRLPALRPALRAALADPAAAQGSLEGLDAAFSPQRGLSLRLRFAPGAYPLSADAVSATAGRQQLADRWALVLHAFPGQPAFSKVTLDLGGGVGVPLPLDV